MVLANMSAINFKKIKVKIMPKKAKDLTIKEHDRFKKKNGYGNNLKDLKCFKCKRRGHFAKDCKNDSKSETSSSEDENSDDKKKRDKRDRNKKNKSKSKIDNIKKIVDDDDDDFDDFELN